MKTIQVSDEIAEGLLAISRELNSQDNRATAMPYFFQVQTKHQIAVPEGNGTEAWNYDGHLIVTDEDINFAIYDYYEGKYSKKQIKGFDGGMKEELLEKMGYRKVWFDYENRLENSFFTEKACDDHIRQNKHNLKEPRSYVSNAHRNPEMELVMKFLCELSVGMVHR